VESVAWVAERKDVLSGVFWMLTLLAYKRYVRRPGAPIYILTLFLFLLGLMSKPMLVTLPLVMLLLDYWPLHRHLNPIHSKWTMVVEKIPFFFLSGLSSFLTYVVQEKWGAVMDQIPAAIRLLNGIHSYVVYLSKTFWPQPLAFYYPHPLDSIPLWRHASSLLILCLITLLAVQLFRRAPFFIVGWLWFLGTLVPVIGFIQVGNHGMADRYTYIPHVGLFIVLAWGSDAIVRKRATLRPIHVALWSLFLVALCTLSWRQVGHWKDSTSLYRHAIEVTSANSVALNNLGNVLARQGMLAEAEQHYRTVLKIDYRNASAHNNLGIVLVKQGRTEEGIRHYETALHIKPGFHEALMNLNIALSRSPDRGFLK